MDYPNKREVQARAATGQPVSQDEVSSLEREEGDMTGIGPIPGGTAGTSHMELIRRNWQEKIHLHLTATAQSVHDRQMNFIAKAGDIARKPEDEITKDDAADIQKREVRQ